MVTTEDFPQIAFVRVLTSGGPYAEGATLSIAFVKPGLARLAAHDGTGETAGLSNGSLVPEMISARVVRGAGPYTVGMSLALSFVDPAIARIHVTDVPSDRDSVAHADIQNSVAAPTHEPPAEGPSKATTPATRPAVELTITRPTEVERLAPETIAAILRASDVRALQSDESIEVRPGVRVRLQWNRDRVRRFVQVVEKLFTIDRIGWYRHVFAMRLLVPDVVTCGATNADTEALRHLQALRAASIETLGRPLLAAFMPGFSVTPEWLDSLDKPGAAKALSGLRETLLPHANETVLSKEQLDPAWTSAAIGRAELTVASASSVESLLPVFVPYVSSMDALTETLSAYRSALIDIFGQTAQSADAVRLHLMAEPNHTLDDRLSQLARTVSETFGSLAVA